jgi:cytochrome c
MRFALVGAIAVLAGGCASAGQSDQMASADDGARLWRMKCAMCHNARPASEFDAREWPVIVSHMRTRAELTRSEAVAVAAFLSNGAADAHDM